MLITGTLGSFFYFSFSGFLLFIVFTAFTLCFGHSPGMHRLFIHKSYKTPKWLEYFLVHLGTLVGIAGPIGMMKTHDMRDWAQRQKQCHEFFSHKKSWLLDAYWQLFCSIQLDDSSTFQLEEEIANDNSIYGWKGIGCCNKCHGLFYFLP